MAEEVIRVDAPDVACGGDGGILGHPKIFLHINAREGEVVCPYCSRRYVLTQKTWPRTGKDAPKGAPAEDTPAKNTPGTAAGGKS